MVGNNNLPDSGSDSDSEYGCYDEQDEEEDVLFSDMEENELFTLTEFASTIDIGRIIAIYLCQAVNDSCFLCKVLEKTHANTNMNEFNDHHIPTSTDYMICSYLQKTFDNIYQVTFSAS